MKLSQERLVINVIIDGQVLKHNLEYTGNDEMWLQKQLVSQGVNSVNEVFLATLNSDNKLSVYVKKDFNGSEDILN